MISANTYTVQQHKFLISAYVLLIVCPFVFVCTNISHLTGEELLKVLGRLGGHFRILGPHGTF